MSQLACVRCVSVCVACLLEVPEERAFFELHAGAVTGPVCLTPLASRSPHNLTPCLRP
jgi:hypothetical protein